MIELLEVSKRYAERVALQPVSLRLPARLTTALIGTSGSGKSTVLRMINGLVPPDTGRVLIDGVQVNAQSVQGLRRAMGYVIQDGGLFPHLTAARNVTLLAEHVGMDAKASEERTRELVELVRLSPSLLDAYPHELSGGERQRVSLMRALFMSPKVLLLDEPLGALDPITRAAVQLELRELFQRVRITTVLVTHDMAEAATVADHVVLLHEGRVLQQGPFVELVEKPASELVRRFVATQQRTARAVLGEAR